MVISTTSSLDGKKIKEYRGVVFGEVICGINFIKDFTASITNFTGGRAEEYEEELVNSRADAINEMIERAKKIGANALIGVKIDIEDDGRVIAYHTDYAIIDKALAMIEEVVREVEIGKVYTGKVKTIEDFGCFVELWPGCEGLVHVSQLDVKRVEKPSDVVKVGDEIVVKATGFDKRGKLNLSRKEVLMGNKDKEEN